MGYFFETACNSMMSMDLPYHPSFRRGLRNIKIPETWIPDLEFNSVRASQCTDNEHLSCGTRRAMAREDNSGGVIVFGGSDAKFLLRHIRDSARNRVSKLPPTLMVARGAVQLRRRHAPGFHDRAE